MVFVYGFILGISLIISLGPQNLFLIRQGVLKQHALVSATACFVCDIILIGGSITGLHHVLEQHPSLTFWLTLAGSVFLLIYGSKSIRGAITQSGPKQTNTENGESSYWKIIFLALGFSLLNPQAIIDSMIIIGGGSVPYSAHITTFLIGVLTASFLWFFLLTLTAYHFSDFLIQDKIWGGLQLLSGILMIVIAIKLILPT
ncbi:LysE/ArgO family amino acid transporter [Legionella sp. W05-934-2]|uniref:LysE/ArgO family amino acid transporter n=1 Tax=Legionella sp. W05-934-2 TaxID=1198649 RepID=UPI003461FD23